MTAAREVWITGIGILTTAGEGTHLHSPGVLDRAPLTETADISQYPVNPLCAVDFSKQITKTSEQRQMSRWQRIGVYAAGLALDDAGLSGHAEMLERTHLVVAAGNGDRDLAFDVKVLERGLIDGMPAGSLNEALLTGLRPTLYLGELSNLLAGNISIVHHVTGSSRTFKGEEIAGVSAIENACRRIAADQGDIFLAGGALHAEREDLLLGYELGQILWPHTPIPVWSRKDRGGGLVLGSVGAFLVLEAREHAEERDRVPYARIKAVHSDRCRRQPGEVRQNLARLFEKLNLAEGPVAAISGASGVEPVTSEERDFLQGLAASGWQASIRAHGSRIGHGMEAHFPAAVCLAALSLAAERFYEPMTDCAVEARHPGSDLARILVTGAGHWRGEGLALLERVA